MGFVGARGVWISATLTKRGADPFEGRVRGTAGEQFSIHAMIEAKYRLLRVQCGSGEVQRRASFGRG